MKYLTELIKINFVAFKKTVRPTPVSKWLNKAKRAQKITNESDFSIKLAAWTTALSVMTIVLAMIGISLVNYFNLIGRINNLDALSFIAISSGIISSWFYLILKKRNKDLLQITYANAINTIEVFSLLSKLVELRDPETNGHNLRVTLLTIMFCEELKVPPAILIRTAKGAVLHDIGKIVTPDCIVGKPGPLTNNERIIMQQHVKNGIRLIAESSVTYEALRVVYGHHEKYDGSGYPFGLKGRDIPLEARIFAIIDVFDALVSKRVYKSALSCEEAVDTMRKESGLHFDPELLAQFINLAPQIIENVSHSNEELKIRINENLLKYFKHLNPSIN